MKKLGRKKKREMEQQLQDDINDLFNQFISIHEPSDDLITDIERYTREVILLMVKTYK